MNVFAFGVVQYLDVIDDREKYMKYCDENLARGVSVVPSRVLSNMIRKHNAVPRRSFVRGVDDLISEMGNNSKKKSICTSNKLGYTRVMVPITIAEETMEVHVIPELLCIPLPQTYWRHRYKVARNMQCVI